MPRITPLLSLAAVAAAALVLSACGGGSSYGGSSGKSSSASTGGGTSAAATLKTASTKVGTVVVDGSGRTLYLFEKDGRAKSACSGACAQNWPPFTATSAPK